MIGQQVGTVRNSVATWWRLVLLLVVAAGIGFGARGVAQAIESRVGVHHAAMPQSAAMEDKLGIRFSRIAVVGDGGLVTVSYVVLDPEKASRFQADTTHPPVLTSQARHGGTQRVSLMKQGHSLRAGETYYLVYQNTKGALRHGELATIGYGDLQLRGVPVL